MKKSMGSFDDLEDRLIRFAIIIVRITNEITNSYSGHHLKNQLVRSGTSPALNYAEARFAESRKDFVHKVKIVLKELCETRVCLRILMNAGVYRGKENLDSVIKESSELIAIFVTSINTAKKSLNQK